jgi:hypothetical protein
VFFNKEKREGYVSKMRARTEPINTSANIAEAARIAKTFSTPEYLSYAFFNSLHPDFLYKEVLPSGGKVSVCVPTSPYTEQSVLVVAAGPDSFNHNPVKTEAIYDYPADVQNAYWEKILTSLDVFAYESSGQPLSHAVAVENCIAVRTNDQVRTSRSIALPHAHILCINEASLENEDWSLAHLTFEQRVLHNKRLMGVFLKELAKGTQLQDLTARAFAPYGYSFTLWQEGEKTPRDKAVTQRLAKHHWAYAQTAQTAETELSARNASKIIPQPSYRLYLSAEGGAVRAIVSPEFLSPAGVMEAAGIRLERNTAYPQRVPQENSDRVYRNLKRELTKKKLR